MYCICTHNLQGAKNCISWYILLVWGQSDIFQSILRRIICLGHRELGMSWRGAVT